MHVKRQRRRDGRHGDSLTDHRGSAIRIANACDWRRRDGCVARNAQLYNPIAAAVLGDLGTGGVRERGAAHLGDQRADVG